jgi:hypothetical protein
MPETLRATLDRFFSTYLECDLTNVAPGYAWVIPANRRELPELHYENPFALWLIATGNRCVISVRPALETAVRRQTSRLWLGAFRDPAGQKALIDTVARALGPKTRLAAVSGPILFASTATFHLLDLHPCRQITPADRPLLTAAGLYGPYLDKSIQEGTCFAAFENENPVSVAGTWEVPHLADRIAEMCVPGTIPAKRREGYGKTALSYATRAVLNTGRIPLYITSDRNPASIACARAVGYQPYGWQFRIEVITEKPHSPTT